MNQRVIIFISMTPVYYIFTVNLFKTFSGINSTYCNESTSSHLATHNHFHFSISWLNVILKLLGEFPAVVPTCTYSDT